MFSESKIIEATPKIENMTQKIDELNNSKTILEKQTEIKVPKIKPRSIIIKTNLENKKYEETQQNERNTQNLSNQNENRLKIISRSSKQFPVPFLTPKGDGSLKEIDIKDFKRRSTVGSKIRDQVKENKKQEKVSFFKKIFGVFSRNSVKVNREKRDGVLKGGLLKRKFKEDDDFENNNNLKENISEQESQRKSISKSKNKKVKFQNSKEVYFKYIL